MITPMLCAQGMLPHIAHDAIMCVSCNVPTFLFLPVQVTHALSCYVYALATFSARQPIPESTLTQH